MKFSVKFTFTPRQHSAIPFLCLETVMTDTARLPFPYRPEADIVAHRLEALNDHLNWPAAARAAAPWVQAVRDNPPPFWAMESLLKEYPISSAEGLALMRLAEALLRVPDAETAIALTADQLGRANFDGSSDNPVAPVEHGHRHVQAFFAQRASSGRSQPG
jgi:RHH-type proline utilization regulon transcriptional repressor/proline dehydrogenase/delta 1-pyrroline-5-carboxylate dehydrogenase